MRAGAYDTVRLSKKGKTARLRKGAFVGKRNFEKRIKRANSREKSMKIDKRKSGGLGVRLSAFLKKTRKKRMRATAYAL